jgi:hypothetical protein
MQALVPGASPPLVIMPMRFIAVGHWLLAIG